MFYVSLTIGRNIGNSAMAYARWAQFQRELSSALHTHASVDGIIFTGEGAGVWGSDSEPAHCLIALCSDIDAVALREDLAHLSAQFEQDAIGCAILPLASSDDSLVYPTE